jgi:hypothetical protein
MPQNYDTYRLQVMNDQGIRGEERRHLPWKATWEFPVAASAAKAVETANANVDSLTRNIFKFVLWMSGFHLEIIF